MEEARSRPPTSVPGDATQPSNVPVDESAQSAVLEDEEGRSYVVDQENAGPESEEGSGEWPSPRTPPEAPAPGSVDGP